jgi:hypothetical protein
MSQVLPGGKSVREAADTFRAGIDAQQVSRRAADGARRAALDDTARAMLTRDHAPREGKPLSYSELVHAWQQANGNQPPMSTLRRWAHSGVSEAERGSQWYQTGMGGHGGAQATADTGCRKSAGPEMDLSAEL